jgi:hypothetical protein
MHAALRITSPQLSSDPLHSDLPVYFRGRENIFRISLKAYGRGLSETPSTIHEITLGVIYDYTA